jgi:hypothetical protein
VVLVGLASKNAILIVEFARQLQSEGKPIREATLEACRLRLRPILMTSFAFILGVVPLVIATGAQGRSPRAPVPIRILRHAHRTALHQVTLTTPSPPLFPPRETTTPKPSSAFKSTWSAAAN